MLRLLALLTLGLVSPALAQATIDGVSVDLELIGEDFSRPVGVVPLPGDGRLLVVEKTGTVRFIEEGEPGPVFLDIADRVSRGNEQGLLGLVFDPEFTTNGQFYVNYTNTKGDTQIVRFTVSGGVADPASGKVLLSVDQPEPNHNGGWIAFGPDHMLYIAMGDGGGGGDRHGASGNGQNPNVLLGKVLRIDPRGEPYAIPEGNPFAKGGGAPEVFLIGVRNPWRNAFDGNLLYVADVGQDMWEEINVVDVTKDAGANLGWRTMEGRECFPPGTMCVQGGMVMPIHVYGHDWGCSITGGIVYRGKALPALAGRYFFADYCGGFVEGLRYENGQATGIVNAMGGIGGIGNVPSFGTDADGEMLIMNDTGMIFRLVPD